MLIWIILLVAGAILWGWELYEEYRFNKVTKPIMDAIVMENVYKCQLYEQYEKVRRETEKES